jgi:hypothetical protein
MPLALAERVSAPRLPTPAPLDGLPLSDVPLGPVVMADDPCEAAFGSAGPTGPRKYYRARYYDPKLGRFISEDPIGFEAGENFYAYVANNPVLWIDPEGLLLMPPPAGMAGRASAFYRQIHRDMQQRVRTGFQRFGGEALDFARHCVTSCEAARDYGTASIPRAYGMANEARGAYRDIVSWFRGGPTGAFDVWDLAANEIGLSCAGACESCEECCSHFGPWWE